MAPWYLATDAQGNPYYWQDGGHAQYEVPPDYVPPGRQNQQNAGHETTVVHEAPGQSLVSPWVSHDIDGGEGYAGFEHGKIKFPASKRDRARWVKVRDLTSIADFRRVITLMKRSWRLPAPSVIISITGGAKSLELTDKQHLVRVHRTYHRMRATSSVCCTS